MLERPWAVFGLWAAFLAISLTLLRAVIGLGPVEGWIPVATFLAAIAITLAFALLAAAGARRRRRAAASASVPEAIPDFRFPTVLAAVALAAIALGLELGPWLMLIGAGALVVALASAASEGRATRRAAARAAAAEERR